MVTRIDFESRSGHRRAIVRRVQNDHVPPLGVTWVLELEEVDGMTRRLTSDYTARRYAEADARSWTKDPRG